MKRNILIFITIAILSTIAMPILAQDGMTVTVPPSDNESLLIGGLLFLAGVAITLFGGVIATVFIGLPGILKAAITAALNEAVIVIDNKVADTTTNADDIAWEEIKAWGRARGIISGDGSEDNVG